MGPVIIFCATGKLHVIMCVWAIRSLRQYSFNTIEVIVSNASEKALLHEHLGDIECEVIDVDLEGYRPWAWRPFALEQYQVKNKGREIVICDTDILWKQDPRPLFERFKGKAWVHKITSLDPAELDLYTDVHDIPERRIGLRTMVSYYHRVGLSRFPNFHLNCGLFMLPKDTFDTALKRWTETIRSIPPDEMIMTEALLALVYGEMEISPISDRNDIKHLDVKQRGASRPVTKFEVADPAEGLHTGYQTAKHYFGDQRPALFVDVVRMGLDTDGLMTAVKRDFRRSQIRRWKSLPGKMASRVLRHKA